MACTHMQLYTPHIVMCIIMCCDTIGLVSLIYLRWDKCMVYITVLYVQGISILFAFVCASPCSHFLCSVMVVKGILSCGFMCIMYLQGQIFRGSSDWLMHIKTQLYGCQKQLGMENTYCRLGNFRVVKLSCEKFSWS